MYLQVHVLHKSLAYILLLEPRQMPRDLYTSISYAKPFLSLSGFPLNLMFLQSATKLK